MKLAHLYKLNPSNRQSAEMGNWVFKRCSRFRSFSDPPGVVKIDHSINAETLKLK